MKDIIIFSGAPGSGKTTIAKMLRDKYEFPMIDLGWIRGYHLDRMWKKASKREEQMSFENLVFILKNYKKYGYKNVIVLDLQEEKIKQLTRLFSKSNYVILTLLVKNDEELKRRVLGERDSGFKDFNKAFFWNRTFQKRKLLKNEIRIDNTHRDPKKTLEEISKLLKLTK